MFTSMNPHEMLWMSDKLLVEEKLEVVHMACSSAKADNLLVIRCTACTVSMKLYEVNNICICFISIRTYHSSAASDRGLHHEPMSVIEERLVNCKALGSSPLRKVLEGHSVRGYRMSHKLGVPEPCFHIQIVDRIA